LEGEIYHRTTTATTADIHRSRWSPTVSGPIR